MSEYTPWHATMTVDKEGHDPEFWKQRKQLVLQFLESGSRRLFRVFFLVLRIKAPATRATSSLCIALFVYFNLVTVQFVLAPCY